MADLLQVNNTYNVVIYDSDAAGSNFVAGTAILRICDIRANTGELVSGSFQFIGTGALS
jgi:hypothetical protein